MCYFWKLVVDGHGCYTALHLVSKLKKPKTKFLRGINNKNDPQKKHRLGRSVKIVLLEDLKKFL